MLPGASRAVRGLPHHNWPSRRDAPWRRVFLRPAKGARIVGEYVCDANAAFAPRPSAVAFENGKGLRRVVFGHDVFGGAMSVASAGRILQMHRLADWASHGRSPVVMETPTRSFVQPRVRRDGTLASIVFVNASIGELRRIRLRLRGVPSTSRTAIWSAFDEKDVRLNVVRDGSDAIVEIPSVGGWNGGYILFEEDK